jgi:DNA-binding GntR family transcriptional regulator
MASRRSTQDSSSRKPLRMVLSDETYETIRNMLLTHEIKPGERVNIDALARQLDVSQTPVREALARLESDELVVKQPLRGYAATPVLSVKQLDDLFQFRAIIEPWAASAAATHISPAGSEALRQELEAGRAAGEMDIDNAYAAMSEHDARFHELIARESGSEFVRDAFARTHCHLHLFRLYQVLQTWMSDSREDAKVVSELFKLYYQPEGGFLAFREHEAIAQAILEGRSDDAEMLMRGHIESSRQRFGPTMEAINRGSIAS